MQPMTCDSRNALDAERADRGARAFVIWPLLVGIALLIAACATPPPADDPDALAEYKATNDPLEPMNRAIFSFNQFADKILLKPLSLLYRDMVPPEARKGVHNMFGNLRSPVTLANDLLQGDMDRASITVQRFAVNSTAGVGGLFDVAASYGLEGHREDFGQTLAIWGSGEGVYLVLPILGPSNPRDGVGLLADGFMDPLDYVAPFGALAARTVVRGVDERLRVIDTLDEIERTSIDYYATLRSLYRQRRGDEIRNGGPPPIIPIPSLSFEGDTDPDQLSRAD